MRIAISGVKVGIGGGWGKVGGQYHLHPGIVVFPFGVKKSGLHKENVRLPGVLLAMMLIVKCR